MFPAIDELGNECFLTVTVQIPKGSRDGDPYDGYAEAENYRLETKRKQDEKVAKAIDLIKEESKKRTEIIPATASFDISRYASYPVEVQVGGATIFVVDVEQFIKA